MTAIPVLDRARVLAFRRRAGSLDRRLPAAPASIRVAAWAGLQDSAPRATLLALHARVEGTRPSAWEDPALVQVWGPRRAVFTVATEDRAAFTLGTLSDDPLQRARAVEVADRIEAWLAGGRAASAAVAQGIGVDAGVLRDVGATGRIVIRWDGARTPEVRAVPAPDVDPFQARVELVRRYLHVCGPATPDGLAWWAGLSPSSTRAAFDALERELLEVLGPLGRGWVLASDEPLLAADAEAPRVRLLPSGDPYLMAADRALLVEDAGHRSELWPAGNVWPGGIMLGGELAGTWRRSGRRMRVRPWRPFSGDERMAVEEEARSLPLPDRGAGMAVSWEA